MDNADIEDIFAALGPVTIKRLFSGKGVYCRGLIVGAVMDDEVLLKADAETVPKFAAAGATQWTFTYPNGKTIHMPYWGIPNEALDDRDALAIWVRLAFAAASRAPVKQPARKRIKALK
jgi:DNA transformation protein and related proteins